MANLLKNPGFEGNWWRKTYSGQEFGEIFVPEHWVAFWNEGGAAPHDPTVRYGRPEMHVINREPPFLDPLRIHGGNRALKFFTFFRIHDAGVFQTVTGVTPGARLRATGWAHAWSSGQDNPRASDGVGAGPYFVRAVDYDKTDGVRNFTFTVGIDPTGGTDPWGSSVVWGEGAHIYNGYGQIPEVEAVAQGSTVTVFVRSAVLWRFKHCDAYVDEMVLEAVGGEPLAVSLSTLSPVEGEPFEVTASGGPGPEALTLKFAGGEVFQRVAARTASEVRWRCVGVKPGGCTAQIVAHDQVLKQVPFTVTEHQDTGVPPINFVPPREDYARTYLLLPPGTGDAWMQAVLDSGAWSKHQWTIGGSADDAGGGPTQRKVIAVNPHGWPSDLKAFFDQYYPGVDYVAVIAATPEDLQRMLSQM